MFFSIITVQGRIYRDLRLPGVSAAERTALYVAAVEVLARLHSLDLTSLNLQSYGRGPGYCKRQVRWHESNRTFLLVFVVAPFRSVSLSLKVVTWTKQYTAAAHKDIPAMNELSDWLMKNLPANDEEVTLVHGDIRVDNLIFHPTEVQFFLTLLVSPRCL